MPYKYSIPRMSSLIEQIQENDAPKNWSEFWSTVAHELALMIEYGATTEQPEIVLSPCKHIGSQYIWEFWVNDLAKDFRENYNRHGQNTSRWVYAGAIVLQNGQVSSHH